MLSNLTKDEIYYIHQSSLIFVASYLTIYLPIRLVKRDLLLVNKSMFIHPCHSLSLCSCVFGNEFQEYMPCEKYIKLQLQWQN